MIAQNVFISLFVGCICDSGDIGGKPQVDARQQAVVKVEELHKRFQEIVQWEAGKVCVCVCVCVCVSVCVHMRMCV